MAGTVEETGLGVGYVLCGFGKVSYALAEEWWQEVGLLHVIQEYPLEQGPGLATLESAVPVEDS